MQEGGEQNERMESDPNSYGALIEPQTRTELTTRH